MQLTLGVMYEYYLCWANYPPVLTCDCFIGFFMNKTTSIKNKIFGILQKMIFFLPQ